MNELERHEIGKGLIFTPQKQGVDTLEKPPNIQSGEEARPISQAPFRPFSGLCYRVRRAARAWAVPGTSGGCVHCSVAASVNTRADCQLTELKNKGSFGERWSMGAGLAPSWHGIRTFGEKRNRKGSENVGELEKPVLTCAAHCSRPILVGCGLCLKVGDLE